MQVSTGVPAARKRGGRRHTKGTCWGRVASEPRAWAADPPSWSEALEIDEARAPWPRQAGRSHRLGVAEAAVRPPRRLGIVRLGRLTCTCETPASNAKAASANADPRHSSSASSSRRRAAAASPPTRAARASPMSVSKRRASIASASTASRYPDATVSNIEPARPSERRRRDAVTRSLRIASAGAARGHSASATDSADTGCGARTVNKVNSARCLPAGTQTRAPFTCASSDPRIAICSTITTANTTPAHTRCERHARATQLRAAMVPSVQATTPTRRPQCRSTAPPSTPPGPRIGRGEAGRGTRARSGRAGGDLLDRGRLPVETRFVVPRHPTGSRVAALVRELAAFMFLADGVRNELLGRDARLSGGARLQAWSGRRVG